MPIVYMARNEMILMRANPFRRPLEGVSPENRGFFWAQMAIAWLVAILGPTPSKGPRNEFARMNRSIQTIGALIVNFWSFPL
jgi:hypothetical protein